MTSKSPMESGRPGVGVTLPRYDEAFRVADALNVHGSDCVCPPCAGRLPGLLRDLARALGDGEDR